MLTNQSADKIAGLYNDKYHAQEITERQILSMEGIPYSEFYPMNPQTVQLPGVYWVEVPSLNLPGINHVLLMEADGEFYWVHDPQHGTGKKYYSAQDPEDPLGFKLLSWTTLAHVPLSFIAEKYGVPVPEVVSAPQHTDAGN